MIVTTTQALTILEQIATTAQQSGLVPNGPYTLALGLLVAGLHGALAQGGLLHPSSPIELNDLGNAFDQAVDHMRQVLAERTPLGQVPPA